MKQSHTFVEHHNFKKKFVTDIWYHPARCTYSSIISDLDNVTFSTVEEIRTYLDKKMEENKNGSTKD